MTKIKLVVFAFAFVSLAVKHSHQCNCNPGFNFPGDNVEQYAIHKGLEKAQRSISACFWLNVPASYIESGYAPTYLSYATSQSTNEFVIWIVKRGIVVASRGTSITAPLLNIADGKNHHLCVTWEFTLGSVRMYIDGVARLARTRPLSYPIPAGGIWIVGQDQDKLGGGFSKRDSVKGLVAEVNIWDRVLCPYEVAALASSCGPILKGNAKSHNQFEPKGRLEIIDKPSCCL